MNNTTLYLCLAWVTLITFGTYLVGSIWGTDLGFTWFVYVVLAGFVVAYYAWGNS